MGSSYRSELKSGWVKEWEGPLREAIAIIDGVIARVSEVIGDDGQYDNAADDGGLIEKLYLAKRFILEELPESSDA